MNTAMDALKYNYMSAAAGHSMGLYNFGSGQDGSAASAGTGGGAQAASGGGSDQTKTNSSYTDALSRSYLEQQKSYYESAGLKGYGTAATGGGISNGVERNQSSGFEAKSYTPDSMSERQSTESPDIKKTAAAVAVSGSGLDTTSQQLQQQQQQAAALQAYYSGQATPTAAGAQAATGLPPLLPMAAQLSQYTAGTGYPQTSPGTDYSRRPLSVLF